MRTLGTVLLIVGASCLAFVLSGLAAWTTPVEEGDTPASLAGVINLKLLLCSALGVLSTLGGLLAILRGDGQKGSPGTPGPATR